MLRAVSRLYCDGQALEALARRDGFKLLRAAVHTSHASHDSQSGAGQTVLTSPAPPSTAAAAAAPAQHSTAPPPPPPPPPPPRRSWVAVVAAVALTSSIGGVYYYNKMKDGAIEKAPKKAAAAKRPSGGADSDSEGELYPGSGAALPSHVEFLVVGGGTAAFAALRALRAARPDAQLLLAGAERAPPYMRPPLSKELWRRVDLAAAAADPLALAFTQYNGKQRKLVYEPLSFYTPLEKLAAGGAGAALARGWRVTRLDVSRRAAELSAPGQPPVTVTFDKCLIATGSVPSRLPALEPAAAAGRSLVLHSVRDVARLARALQHEGTRRVCVVGAGLLAAELAASLAERLRPDGVAVVQVCREPAPLAELLPHYLAADAARRLRDLGVTLLPDSEIESCSVSDNRVHMKLKRTEGAGEAEGQEPGSLTADVVVECVGAEPAVELAQAAGLELHPELGGFVVNAELQARSGVWAAGDVACFHDVTLGRRRVTHHDHAVLSGRRAAQNMAGASPEPYTHQSMFWSDLGPQLGYEAIGIVDSRLPTVAVFSSDAVQPAAAATAVVAQDSGAATATVVAQDSGADTATVVAQDSGADTATVVAQDSGADTATVVAQDSGADTATVVAQDSGADTATVVAQDSVAATATVAAQDSGADAAPAYERGVVFYLRERRVVGVLLWNLFNRMHVARQVLAQGEFEDLLEVAKLFAPHEDD